MPVCLSRNELETLIHMETGGNIDWENDNHLELRIENARNWADQLVALVYFLAKIFEKKLKEGRGTESLSEELNKIYRLEESMWFELQEFDRDFISYTWKFQRDSSSSLEDQLIQLQDKLSEYEYV